MEDFIQALEVNNIYDLEWKGNKYKCNNRHTNEIFTKDRLDRVVANTQLTYLFRYRKVEILVARQSDRRPLLREASEENQVVQNRKRIFRFEAKWVMDEEGGTMIKEAWARMMQK